MDIWNGEYCSFVSDRNENESDILMQDDEDDIQALNNVNEINNLHDDGQHTVNVNNDAVRW